MTTTDHASVAERTAGAGAWRLNVLGPVELCYDGEPVEVTGATRTLLALLARTPGEEIGTATIVAGMWGSQPPEDSEKEVASHISRLRKALTAVAPHIDPTSVVVTMPSGYILAVEPSNADILAFERLTTDGNRAFTVGQPALAVDRLEAALALWRGRAYADFDDHSFVHTEAARLEELRLAAIESKVEATLAGAAPSAPESVVVELQALLAEHWHRERLWIHLMTALYRLGRREEALAVFGQARDRMVSGMGVEPSGQLRGAERAVIVDDPALYGRPRQVLEVPAPLTVTLPVCVGRDEELAWLSGALDLAATRRAQARVIVGSPGIGKTRMLAELAQRAAARGVRVRYWQANALGIDTLVADPDALCLVIIDDLDQAPHDDIARVTSFIRSAMSRPVVTLISCRDPVRVGDLASLPKLVLSALDDHAVADIVRVYAPAVADGTAVAAMASTGGVPGRVHRAASEWAFGRAGRRIDRAVADAVEPTRRLELVRDEVVAGVLDLAHVRAQARPLRPAARDLVTCPYRGPDRFEAADAEIFHGRDRAVAELVSRLVESRLLAVVGATGAGKSSLVRAGLLPALSAGALPDSARWRQVVVIPGLTTSLSDHLAPHLADLLPDDVLFTDLHTDVPPPDPTPDVVDQGEIGVEERSNHANLSLIDEVAEGEKEEGEGGEGRAGVGEESIVLVVDQLEEVFTVLDADARAAFLATLVQTTGTGRVVVTVRSDFYARCAEYPELAALMTANTVLVAPMTSEEIRRAVELPAQAAGLAVEDGLTDLIVAESTGSLTHLSTALLAAWERRTGAVITVAGYRAGGGVAGAVEALAENAYARMSSPDEVEAARRILLRLCRRGAAGAVVRHRSTLAEVIAAAGTAGPAALQKLVDGRLVTVSPDAVDVTHEALVEHWPRIRAWLDDEAARQSLRQHLTESASAWAGAGRPAAPTRGPGLLYHGARLAAALDLARELPTAVTPVEHDFLGASQRVVLATDIRRRRRAERLWKWLVATLLVALLATAIAAVSVTMQVRTAAAAVRADGRQLAAAAVREPNLRRGILLAVAGSRLDEGTAPTVREVLQRAPDLMAAVGADVTAVAASPDGRSVAAASTSGAIYLLAGDGLSTVARLEVPGHGPVNGLAFTVDGRRLVSWGGSRTAQSTATASIVVWDVAGKQQVGPAFGQIWPDAGGGLLADGVTLVLAQHGTDAGELPTAVAWSIEARTPSTVYELPDAGVEAMRVSPDGRYVTVGTPDGAVIVDPAAGATRPVRGARDPLALSPDGRTLLTGDGANVGVWDATSGVRKAQLVRHTGEVLGAAWSTDARTFATSGADGLVVIWDTATLQPIRTLAGHGSPVRMVRFAADGRTLYTVGDDGSLLAWDLTGTRGVGTRLADATPAAVIGLACALAGRDLTPEEWHASLPSRGYQHVCPG